MNEKYHSILLDPSEQKAPPCTRYVVVLAAIVQKVNAVVRKHLLIIHTDHAVSAFIDSQPFSITPGRAAKTVQILTQPHITYQTGQVLIYDHMDGLTLHSTEPHECEAITEAVDKIKPDVTKTPLLQTVNLYIDGSSYRDGPLLKTGYAVVRHDGECAFFVVSSGQVMPASSQGRTSSPL